MVIVVEMANTSLYEICRLCMAVLDRDAIDCSKYENSELRENIEMIYGIKVNELEGNWMWSGWQCEMGICS